MSHTQIENRPAMEAGDAVELKTQIMALCRSYLDDLDSPPSGKALHRSLDRIEAMLAKVGA